MSETRNNFKITVKAEHTALPAIDWSLTARKVGLSVLVIAGFASYAYRDHFGITPDGAAAAVQPAALAAQGSQSGATANSRQTSGPAAPAAAIPANTYKDGTYAGPSVDVYYGNVQVQATIQGGKITQVKFLDYPHDRRTSQMINNQAIPWLNSEAVQSQSAQVDIISGATFTSEGFQQSLQTALAQAKAQSDPG